MHGVILCGVNYFWHLLMVEIESISNNPFQHAVCRHVTMAAYIQINLKLSSIKYTLIYLYTLKHNMVKII